MQPFSFPANISTAPVFTTIAQDDAHIHTTNSQIFTNFAKTKISLIIYLFKKMCSQNTQNIYRRVNKAIW